MKLLFIPLLALPALGLAQTSLPALNLGFEQVSPQTHQPLGWQSSIKAGMPPAFTKGYQVAADLGPGVMRGGWGAM